MMKIIELTKENESRYLEQIAELEQITMEVMKREGREGQLFPTGKVDISGYVHSEENSVIIAADEKDNVNAVTYITQGQNVFTYNDITKYFKFGEAYKKYIKGLYSDEQTYKKDLLDIYKIKIQAFTYAKNKILEQYPQFKTLREFLNKEVEENGFHENSELREKINEYMSRYISENFDVDIQRKYEQFYWMTSSEIAEEFGRNITKLNVQAQDYDQVIEKSRLTIYEEPRFRQEQYYSATPKNSIELDTYITSPNNRSAGIARVIVFEGIRKHMEKHFKNPQNNEIFLCSTLHRDNLSSKYVSEFFGLTDKLYVKRRQGRNREVHICRIEREHAMEYLTQISDKLAVLYGYNPNNKHIPDSVKRKVLEEQLKYEKREHRKLKRTKKTNKKFRGINIERKCKKIKKLKQTLQSLEESRGE